jgi:hypothetical protein
MLLFENTNPKLSKKHKILFDEIGDNFIKLIELANNNKNFIKENKNPNELILNYKNKIIDLEKEIENLNLNKKGLKKDLKSNLNIIKEYRLSEQSGELKESNVDLTNKLTRFIKLNEKYEKIKKDLETLNNKKIELTETIDDLLIQNKDLSNTRDLSDDKYTLKKKRENENLSNTNKELIEYNKKLTSESINIIKEKSLDLLNFYKYLAIDVYYKINDLISDINILDNHRPNKEIKNPDPIINSIILEFNNLFENNLELTSLNNEIDKLIEKVKEIYLNLVAKYNEFLKLIQNKVELF